MTIQKNRLFSILIGAALLTIVSCGETPATNDEKPTQQQESAAGTYAYDAAFLRKHTRVPVELRSGDGQSRIFLAADYQGRVMTSSAMGDSGTSFGWLNYDLIGSGKFKSQFNPIGGEERFWLGPEGGQYSVYFKKGDSFSLQYWQVPGLIDTVAYELVSSDQKKAVFSKKASLTNYSGNSFDLSILRTISLLDVAQINQRLSLSLPADILNVAYETRNVLKNEGTTDWTKEKGLLSVWLLGMFTPSPQTTVIIPFKPIKDAGKHITDSYFGNIPAERLQVKDSVLYFTCDGKFRSKLGLSPSIAKPIAASIDFQKNILTIIQFPVNAGGDYVNSKWELQKQPYKGDVVNSYNDGPLADGSQLGPFYELESSSHAAALKKGESLEYTQTTYHFQGSPESIRVLAQQILGVDIQVLKK